MKSIPLLFALLLSLGSSGAFAASAKTYQVTGPILEVTPAMIAVQKGQDRWEIIRDANTKVTGDPKVGSKVTIIYTMTAQTVDVKPAAGAAATKPAAGATKPAAAKPAAKPAAGASAPAH